MRAWLRQQARAMSRTVFYGDELWILVDMPMLVFTCRVW